MFEECTVAVYKTPQEAETAVHILHRADYPPEKISLIANTFEGHPEAVEELSLDDDSAFDAAAGAGLGGVLGVLVGMSVMAVSELGILFLIGPLGGGFVGAVTGGLVGAMSGWGIHERHLRHYQKCLKKGQVLVIAGGDPQEVARAEKILAETQHEELHVHLKTDTEPKPLKEA